jgi:cysteinyl-tRNA synthetase
MVSELTVFNTLTRKNERFESIFPKRVKMFVCGPTVQDYLHVGHAKTYVFYDLVARFLKYKGYRVTFVMNITDIDDKIVQASKNSSLSLEEYIQKYTKAFLEDISHLGVSTVTRFERASKYIPQMIYQVASLIEKGHAYNVDGDVFFDVSSDPFYGELSNQTTAELSLRPIDISAKKRSQLDFALWYSASGNEPHWSSPWGPGKPGWHIEDTAISITNFGPQYDIHGGAYELIYPHHEAEIAQAESFTGVRPFVKYWIHTGLLTIDGKKMSKSEGNVVYLKDILKKYGSSSLRLYVLKEHYRSNTAFDESLLERTEEELVGLREKVTKLKDRAINKRLDEQAPKSGETTFIEALNHDFDTPLALNRLKSVIGDATHLRSAKEATGAYNTVLTASRILGVKLFD